MCDTCVRLVNFTPDCAFSEGEVRGPSGALFVEIADAAANIGTAYSITPADTFQGELGFLGDRDWVAITLTAGNEYDFSLSGSNGGGGSLTDPLLRLYDASGTYITEDDDGGSGVDSLLTYTAATTGTYYLAAGAFDDFYIGTYTISVNETVAPGIVETTDAADSIATTYSMTAGDLFQGEISSIGDRDWIEISLTAGSTYKFAASGIDGGGGTLPDPILRLYDGNGQLLASDDNDGPGDDALLGYNPSNTGTYYIGVGEFGDNDTGSYLVSVTEASVGTLDELALYLTDGYWQDRGGDRAAYDTSTSNVITYDITALTSDGQQLALWGMEAWEMVADIDFVVASGGSAMITFDDDQSGAFATSQITNGFLTSGEVNISTNWLSTYGTEIDSYSFQTYIHEIGHAIGLGHLGNYNGSAVYGQDETFINDSWQQSVMSYFDQDENTSITATDAVAITAMMADIVAIQDLYGAPGASSVTSGNTIWGIGTNLTGYLGYIDDILTGTAPASVYYGDPFSFTIYDRDGTDTVNLSLSITNDRLDMREEMFSDIGGLIGNVGVSRGTVLENAVMGGGDDTVFGNDADNSIQGGVGSDTLSGEGGNDTLDGGLGADSLSGGEGDDYYVVDDAGDSIYEVGNQGTDSVESSQDLRLRPHVEVGILNGLAADDLLLLGNAEDNTLYGDDGDNRLDGKTGSNWLDADDNPILGSGRSGNDTLIDRDGGDTLVGGLGDDTYRITGSDNGATTIVEQAGGGIDIVFSTQTIVVPENVEVVRLYSSADIDATGSAQADEINGNNGANSITGNEGNDTLRGSAGADTIAGGDGADQLRGGKGQDVLNGDGDNDILRGDESADTLDGGAGNDRLIGGAGNDQNTGGTGADIFVFTEAFGFDRVLDFEDTAGSETVADGLDRLQLTGFEALNGGNSLTFDQLLITQVNTTTRIQLDLNEDGVADVVDLDGDSDLDNARIDLAFFTATNLDAFDFIF